MLRLLDCGCDRKVDVAKTPDDKFSKKKMPFHFVGVMMSQTGMDTRSHLLCNVNNAVFWLLAAIKGQQCRKPDDVLSSLMPLLCYPWGHVVTCIACRLPITLGTTKH
jgi:hypothetical protein